MLTAIVLLENLKWLLPTTFMIGAAPAYITIWAGWRAVSCILPRWVYVKGDDFLFSTYHRNLLFFFETLTGVELIFYGDLNALLKTTENSLYISNHQSTMDWVIASCIAKRRGCLGHTRYVLKDGLRFLPFYGFYLGMHGSLFVKRAGKFDKSRAERQLSKDASDKIPTWLVIFPEGTRFNPELPSILQDSKQFAKDQGREGLEHVLFPRSRALEVCVQHLRPNLDSIIDVTIAYGGAYDYKNHQKLVAPTMQDFLMGKSPKVHIHINKIPIDTVPSDSSELKHWLYERFQAKDKLLSHYYECDSAEEARFPGMRVVKPLSLVSLVPSCLFWSGVFTLFNISSVDRAMYWKVGSSIAGLGLVWMAVKQR
ncbi:1-acyl-sn-glycerol-3-phosphate acyltransferase epsilon [Elysia marginata]|uniref:1-acyl-sn-glycerol-3-phosphate acyltransferase epsilon n=1 Tax=Elysia marginata TaxID=1093978 RepID=A0AAV4JAU8_9GAST|nr:1-acyl-sn-glycerol-3-phosphate acyltransferase epsilon [Elysia marginata]